MKWFLLRLCVFVALACSWCQAGSIMYSNLGPAGTDYNSWYSIGSGWTQGFGFSPSSTATLGSIDIVLTKGYDNYAGTGNPTIGLYTSDSTWAVGTLLESWTVPFATLPGLTTDVVTKLNSTGDITLSQGSNYWIIGSNDSTTNTAWALGWPYSSNAYGTYISNGFLYPRAQQGAFAVEDKVPVSATPEPSSALLMSSMLGVFAAFRHRLRRAR